jgi:hypothetical protein
VAGPCPLVIPSVTQDASADAVQEQSRAAVTVTVPLPPAAGTSAVSLVADTAHFAADGWTRFVLADPHPAVAHTKAATDTDRKTFSSRRPGMGRACEMQNARRQE